MVTIFQWQRPVFAFTDGDEWHAGIGDPTFMGWFTVFAYFVAALLSFRAFLQAQPGGSERFFWAAIFLAMSALGINKQLDLQTWVTLTARGLARSEGWYEFRRPLQVGFICMVAVAGVATVVAFWKLAGRYWRKHSLTLSGLIFLSGFVIIRAASFHHVDLFLKYDIGGMRMNWIFEIGGILLVAAGASKSLCFAPKEPRAQPARAPQTKTSF